MAPDVVQLLIVNTICGNSATDLVYAASTGTILSKETDPAVQHNADELMIKDTGWLGPPLNIKNCCCKNARESAPEQSMPTSCPSVGLLLAMFPHLPR